MPFVRLKIPPGVVRNGTKYQTMGRWYVANLVRWSQGAMQPIGGWQKVVDENVAALDLGEPIRGIHGWRSNAQAAYLALGTATKAYGFAGGVLTDITPASFTTGDEGATISVGGYDIGGYDLGPYGVGSSVGNTTEANSWQFDNYGEELVACAYSDGQLLYWDLNVGNNLVAMTNAPTSCKGIVVTPERFVVGLASSGNGRQVSWSDQENYAIWTPDTTNQAGDFILPGTGELMCGRRMPNETLLFTDVDTFAMRFIGGTLVYTFKQVGSNTGVASRRAVATVDGRAFWMGYRGFFVYDGGVRPLPCPIEDDIFPNLNKFEASRIAAWPVSEYNEIWFSYPASPSAECNRIAVYNYLENHWSGPWEIERTDGVDRTSSGYALATDSSGAVYDHERGTVYLDTDDATALTPSAETGPLEVGQGDQLVTVRRYIPDELTAGDVDATLYAGMYPTTTEDSQIITVGSLSDVRLTGRQVRLKIDQDATNWRFGIPRLEYVLRSRR